MIDQVNKQQQQQPQSIFIQSKKPDEEESSQQTDNNKNETTDTIIPDEEQQLLISSKINEDENIESTSDFLVDIIRQIGTKSSTSTDIPEIDSNSSIPNNSVNELDILELTNIMNSILTHQPTTVSNVSQNFYVPQKSTSSETDFTELYQHRYFPYTTMEQTLAQFSPIDDEQLDNKSTTSDFTKLYYELQEQRHNQQPVFKDIETEMKKEISDVNLLNHIDMNSFSSISNLPSKEYRQVFGVSDEIINTVDDLTYRVDQVLQTTVPDEKSQIIDVFQDHQPIISNDANSSTSNAELDLRYSSLLDRVSILIKPLVILQSTTSITENESITSNLPIVTDNKVVESNLSEKQPLSTRLLDTVKNIFSSTTSSETSIENIQPIVETTQQQDTIDKLVDNNESSDIDTKETVSRSFSSIFLNVLLICFHYRCNYRHLFKKNIVVYSIV